MRRIVTDIQRPVLREAVVEYTAFMWQLLNEPPWPREPRTFRASRVGAVLLMVCTLLPTGGHAAAECVILLHGLARSAASMNPVEAALANEGYAVANIDYPSRSGKIEELAAAAVETGIKACSSSEAMTIHIVTHSLGGILVRYYLTDHTLTQLGRVVMLAPPNQGSEVVDNWKDVPGYQAFNGPAGVQLGTGVDSIPNRLGPVRFPLGVIAGNRTWNPILSLSLPNPDDGKVSVEKTKVEGMTDFIEMPHTHTFIMRSQAVIEQVLHFLEHGRFLHDTAGHDDG